MNLAAAFLFWLTIGIPVNIATGIVKLPIIPIAVLCCSTDDNKHLDPAFFWLETIDYDLGGDDGWKKEHIEPGSDPYSDWNRMMWLYRNGGHWVDYYIIGIEDKQDEIGKPARLGLTVRDDGFFLYREYFQVSDEKKLEIFWGWNLWGNIEGRNKFKFTTRFKDLDQF